MHKVNEELSISTHDIHISNRQTEQKRITYLTLPCLSRRMPLQIMVQMCVLNVVINLSSIGLRFGLARWKHQSTAPAPRSIRALPNCIISCQVSIYIKHELVAP